MKGPKDGIIKASFSGCPVSDRSLFPDSHGMLLISVGQLYHENEKMLATFELIGRKFKHYTIMLADTLQRHNIKASMDITEEEAYQISKNNGDKWIEKYEVKANKYKNYLGIQRWDTYLNHPSFEIKKQIIEKAIQGDNSKLKTAIQYSVDEYILRGERANLPKRQITFLRQNCESYLIEECSIMLLLAEENFNFDIYPTSRNAAMETVYNLFIKSEIRKVLAPVSLRFKRYAQSLVL